MHEYITSDICVWKRFVLDKLRSSRMNEKYFLGYIIMLMIPTLYSIFLDVAQYLTRSRILDYYFIHQWLYSPFVGPWPILQFRDLFTQTVGLLERVTSPSQDFYLYIQRTTQTQNKLTHKHPCLE
jgi:hypothetical protein